MREKGHRNTAMTNANGTSTNRLTQTGEGNSTNCCRDNYNDQVRNKPAEIYCNKYEA